MGEELWRNILEFPRYDISNFGRVYNIRRNMMMETSYTTYGHSKITLTAYDGSRHTRSVAQLVADSFVEPPNLLCDNLIILDGDFTNVVYTNLAWRPRQFAWKYTRQLKERQPLHYRNLSVRNCDTGVEYSSIVEAGITEGLLFVDVWRSTYNSQPVYPYGSVFEVIERV